MCGGPLEKPEIILSNLVKNELGITVAPEALRILIRTHWATISACGHAIHNAGKPRRETGDENIGQRRKTDD